MAVTQGYHLWFGPCMVESEKFVHAVGEAQASNLWSAKLSSLFFQKTIL